MWNVDTLEVLDHEIGAFSIPIQCKLVDELEEWVFSGVNGPTLYSEVEDFLGELNDIRACWDLPWCLRGYFNLIRFSHERKGEFRIN